MTTKKLYMAQCGYHPADVEEGMYECHANLFIVAEGEDDAIAKVLALPAYNGHHMHIDSIVEITRVDGFAIELRDDSGAGSAAEPRTALRHIKEPWRRVQQMREQKK